MNVTDAYLVQLDHAWRHEWESLMSVLDGVTEEEAAWQAPCYRGAAVGAEEPPAGTIRWHVTHLAHCKREYTARLRGDREARSPTLPRRPTHNLAEDLAELEAAHQDQRAALQALSESEWTPTVAEFVAGTIRHDVWHGGQIAVARRLWRTRSVG